MKTLYETEHFRVVDNYCPGLKIYDKVMERVDLYHFGAFYDVDGIKAIDRAIECVNHCEEDYPKCFQR